MNLTQILIAELNPYWKSFGMIPQSPTSSRNRGWEVPGSLEMVNMKHFDTNLTGATDCG